MSLGLLHYVDEIVQEGVDLLKVTSGKEELRIWAGCQVCDSNKMITQLVLPGIGSGAKCWTHANTLLTTISPSPSPNTFTINITCIMSKQTGPSRWSSCGPGHGLVNSQIGHQQTHSRPQSHCFYAFYFPILISYFSFSDNGWPDW